MINVYIFAACVYVLYHWKKFILQIRVHVAHRVGPMTGGRVIVKDDLISIGKLLHNSQYQTFLRQRNIVFGIHCTFYEVKPAQTTWVYATPNHNRLGMLHCWSDTVRMVFLTSSTPDVLRSIWPIQWKLTLIRENHRPPLLFRPLVVFFWPNVFYLPHEQCQKRLSSRSTSFESHPCQLKADI